MMFGCQEGGILSTEKRGSLLPFILPGPEQLGADITKRIQLVPRLVQIHK